MAAAKIEGFVYILANESFRKPWLKIGKTDDLKKRLVTLNTSTPYDFEKVAVLKTADMGGVEKRMHRQIKNLLPESWFKDSEFFEISREQAVSALRIIAEDRGEIDGFVEYLGGHEYRKFDKSGKGTVQETPVNERMRKAVFHTKKKGTDIKLRVLDKGKYVVLAGSLLDPMTESFPDTNKTDFIRRQIIEASAAGGRSKYDEEFSSPSAAAATFLGCSSNGRTDWVDDKGKRLGSYFPKGW